MAVIDKDHKRGKVCTRTPSSRSLHGPGVCWGNKNRSKLKNVSYIFAELSKTQFHWRGTISASKCVLVKFEGIEDKLNCESLIKTAVI